MMNGISNIVNNYFDMESLTIVIIALALFNIALILMLAYVYVASKETRDNLEMQVKKYNHMICLINACCKDLGDENSKKTVEMSDIKRRLHKCESEIKYMDVSMRRFAPPLDKDVDYESITFSKTL